MNVLTDGAITAKYWTGNTYAIVEGDNKQLFDLPRKHLQAIHNVLGAVLAMMPPAEPAPEGG